MNPRQNKLELRHKRSFYEETVAYITNRNIKREDM